MIRAWKKLRLTDEEWSDRGVRTCYYIAATIGTIFSILMWLFTAPQGKKPPGSW